MIILKLVILKMRAIAMSLHDDQAFIASFDKR